MTKTSPMTVDRQLGPWGDAAVHGVEFDGTHLWVALGDALEAVDPATGETVRRLEIAADAGTTSDGRHLYQLADTHIYKLDPETGEILAKLPAPGGGQDSGLTWAEGKLWVGQYRARKIHCIDAETGELLRTIESDRFVTGVTWTHGELWHATLEEDQSELRRIDPRTGEVLERHDAPDGVRISGLAADGDTFYGGGGGTGRVRVLRRGA